MHCLMSSLMTNSCRNILCCFRVPHHLYYRQLPKISVELQNHMSQDRRANIHIGRHQLSKMTCFYVDRLIPYKRVRANLQDVGHIQSSQELLLYRNSIIDHSAKYTVVVYVIITFIEVVCVIDITACDYRYSTTFSRYRGRVCI